MFGLMLPILISGADEEAMVCRIVNWKGLNAYQRDKSFEYLDQIWCMASLGHLVVPPSKKDKILSYPLFYFIEWIAKGGGGGSTCNLKF